MIQLGLSSFRTELPDGALQALRAEFDEYHAFQLRNFLAPDLLGFLRKSLPDASFQLFPEGKIAVSLRVTAGENIAVQSLQLRMNAKGLTEFLQNATGVTPLQHFGGRVYRMLAGAGHYDSWHNDIGDGRKLGVSINLSPAPYQGGTFILRFREGQKLIRAMPNLGPGDANFFRIDKALEHMVTPVDGSVPKTAFAGWFHETDNFAEWLRGTSSGAAAAK